eukprot:758705-Hanusia_phi.AAC.2
MGIRADYVANEMCEIRSISVAALQKALNYYPEIADQLDEMREFRENEKVGNCQYLLDDREIQLARWKKLCQTLTESKRELWRKVAFVTEAQRASRGPVRRASTVSDQMPMPSVKSESNFSGSFRKMSEQSAEGSFLNSNGQNNHQPPQVGVNFQAQALPPPPLLEPVLESTKEVDGAFLRSIEGASASPPSLLTRPLPGLRDIFTSRISRLELEMAEFREEMKRHNGEILRMLKGGRMQVGATASDDLEVDISEFESFMSAVSKTTPSHAQQHEQHVRPSMTLTSEHITPLNPIASSVVLVDRGGRQNLKQKLHEMKESLEKRVRETPPGMWRRSSNPFTFRDDKVLRNWKVVNKK